MEEQTLWSPSPSVVVLSDSEDMEVYVEEVVLEEDGSPAEKEWNVDEVLTLSSSGFVKSLDDTSSSDVTDPLATSPQYILPDLLSKEEDNLLEESFELMEDLMSQKNGFEWKEMDKKTIVEKAQELLDDLDEDSWIIKQEPFSDWLEEKVDLPLLEELGGYVNGYQSRSALPATLVAAPYHPRPHPIQIAYVGQTAPQLATSSGLTLLSTGAHIDLANISAHVPCVSAEEPSVSQSAVNQQPPLTPALIREFETVLHQTLTPPHTPPTYIDLVNNQEEEIKRRDFAEEELDALINSQVASFYEEKKEKEWSLSTTQNSPTSDWGSASTSAITEDSDSACQSSSESDPDWTSESVRRGGSNRNRRAVSSTVERKLRKKEQNKNAATRYRMKKKAEQAGIMGEESVLLDHNTSLKEKATELQREIKYLKSLMRDICKAKGLIQ